VHRVSADPLDYSLDVEPLSEHDFKRLSAFINEYAGIKLPPTKRTMLEGRLRRRMRETGHPTVDAYCRHLFDEGGLEAELVDLVDAVTTNKTDFFREPAHFDFLIETALPAMLASGRTRLKLWSAACSTGAEPYTIAMLLADALKDRRGIDFKIVATDLSTAVLREALAGRFPEAMIAPVPYDMRRRYLMRARDERRDEVRIVPTLRSRLSFGRLNLMDDRYPLETDMDVIFCRNVLIYFDKPTQEKVVGRLCEHLRPGGYLFLGHSESITGMRLPVTTVSSTIFQRS
jgi:chemotaxis protein methyltransferase CheR